MENELTLRRLTLNDVHALSLLAKKTFYDSFTGTCTAVDMQQFLSYYYNEATLAKEIEDDTMQYYFAEINNVPVGYILYKEADAIFLGVNEKKSVELKRFYVMQSHHGKGIAQYMMNHFLDFATKNKFSTAFLGVWEYNSRAQYFYAKYGFKQTEARHDFPIGNTMQSDIYLIKEF